MVYKRYYSPFDETKVKKPILESEIITPQKIEREDKHEVFDQEQHKRQSSSPFDFINKIGYDDLIIIGIIIILLMEDKDNRDIPLILSLGFLFLIEYIEAD